MGDHFSGPRVFSDPAADITDLYVFPSPDRPGHVVLIFNAFPGAAATVLFSDAITYRFRVRPVTSASAGAAPTFTVGEEEYTFDFTFTAPASSLSGPRTGRMRRDPGQRCPAGTVLDRDQRVDPFE